MRVKPKLSPAYQWDFPHATDKPQPDSCSRDNSSEAPGKTARARRERETFPTDSRTRTLGRANNNLPRRLGSPTSMNRDFPFPDALQSTLARHLRLPRTFDTSQTDLSRPSGIYEPRP